MARRIVFLAVAAIATLAIVWVTRWPGRSRPPAAPTEGRQPAGSAYADPAACASCHEQIANTYRLTGMGRSFSRLRPETLLADFTERNRLHHRASDRYYTMLERDGRFYQRRHEIGFDGTETNVVELEAHYVTGSGNHAQTFLHRTPDGRLLEMPVSWYAGPSTQLRAGNSTALGAGPSTALRAGPSTALRAGGFWAMSPGYDRPAHQDFRRLINDECMSCHNGYPRATLADEGNGPRFVESLPEGIDCQRCHGPGQAHIDAIRKNDLDAARRVIVNPATLDRDRQLETCMQCHLEPTSSPLPFRIGRYEQQPFSFVPGKALGDHFIYFDHAPGSGREDKFEIASGAYRLRQSACFQRSQMTCVTCHNPHDIARGAKAVQQYVAVCQSCHQDVHRGGPPRVPGAGPRETCLDCHMPQRRTEDAVHVVMTDHYIQRRRVMADLLAPRNEAENFDPLTGSGSPRAKSRGEKGAYRGEVVLYYPPALPPPPDNELYLALAQVQQGSNLTAGIPRLEAAIQKHQPQRPEFYYELARAYASTSNDEADIRWCEEALRRDASFVPALKELAAAATKLGRLAQAAQALEKALALRPRDGLALADLGNVYLLQNRIDEAERVLRQALAIDSTMPRALNTMALVKLRQDETAEAEKHLRAAILSQPDLSEAQNNLGNLLARRNAYAEAAFHFEKAIRSNPNYVEAHHSYGVVLALTSAYVRAEAALRHAVRLAPHLARAHLDLADVLAAMGRTDEAAREYDVVVKTSSDPETRDQALNALRALNR